VTAAQIFLKLFPREVFQLYMAAGYSEATFTPIQNLHKEISFVAPPGCYVCSYVVKRPYAHYQYEKLMSPTAAIFQARSEKNAGKLVKNLHLGRTGSDKHQAALAGIMARKQIAKWERQIEALEEIAALQASQSPTSF